ncbi:MAG: hypothetical protein K5918_07280 [Bacteroidales bacterium]|nr:hypothetical protein [Bacteroidales bacterium]
MKTTKRLLAIAMAVMTFAACQKENSNVLIIEAEGMHNGTKMAIDGNASHWATGDEVYISGADHTGNTYTVNISDGQATVDVSGNSSLRTPLYGVYPAANYVSHSGTVYTVEVPYSYDYATCTDGGTTRQNLQTPMVAYTESGNKMQFKHLTAAVTVEITNHYGFAVNVSDISVESDNYNICGNVEVDMASPISVAPVPESGDNLVTMDFSVKPLKIDQGATAQVQIPVLPVGDNNHFTISVTVKKDGDPNITKTYTKSQEGDGSRALGRAQIGYAPMPVGFTFNIGASQKAIISQGNLQAVTTDSWSSYTWKFAANQYDVVESANVSTDYAGSTTVGLFGYGTSGHNNGQTCYQPYKTSDESNHYIKSSLTGNKDWGYNAITNGGNVENYGWRTPSKTESSYLFANNTNGLATIDDTHKGIVILPNGWKLPGGCSFTAGYGSGFTTNTYTTAQWRKMEANGAVFLPATGSRLGTTYYNLDNNSDIRYWTSTTELHMSSYYTYMMEYTTSGGYQNDASAGRVLGIPVRLIKDID